MRTTKLLLLIFCGLFLATSCTKDEIDGENADGISPTDINGTWKESKSGFIVRISGVSENGSGTGTVVNVGTAMPAAAKGGSCLTGVQHMLGGSWIAANNTFYPPNTWQQTSTVTLSMTTLKEFKMGGVIYTRQ